MACDYLIRNGRVVDPSMGTDRVENIAIRNGKLVEYDGVDAQAGEIIDASGCLVVSGLIDFHSHLNYAHTAMGIHPDLALLPYGITAAVDAGSAGCDGYEGFVRDTVYRSEATIKSFINVIPRGIMDSAPPQEVEIPANAYDRLSYLLDAYRGQALGIKLWSQLGGRSLEDAVRLAEQLRCRLCIHASAPLRDMSEILDQLRGGDIIAHYTQSHRNTIMDADGRLLAATENARKRGVIFDVAHGRANYSLDIAKALLAQGFAPDVISSDVVTGMTAYKPNTFGLLYVMTCYLALGLPLAEVIKAVTTTPAELMERPELGTLRAGTTADVTILKLEPYGSAIKDAVGSNPLAGKGMFMPMLTLKNGKIAYRRMDFTFGAC